jgi:hypothetical protein
MLSFPSKPVISYFSFDPSAKSHRHFTATRQRLPYPRSRRARALSYWPWPIRNLTKPSPTAHEEKISAQRTHTLVSTMTNLKPDETSIWRWGGSVVITLAIERAKLEGAWRDQRFTTLAQKKFARVLKSEGMLVTK